MTLKQLKYFLKIAETENLTKAAQLLNISQPPLSYQLKLLEDELGVSLFVREARNLSITEEGLFLKERALKIIEDVEKLTEDMSNFSAKHHIVLNLGTVSSVNQNILPDIVEAFNEKHHNAVVNIYDGSSMRILELLEKRVIDIGILREPFNQNVFCSKRIQVAGFEEDDYFVAVGKEKLFQNNHPDEIKLEQLGKSPLIVHRRFEEMLVEKCEKLNLHPHIVSRNDNIVTSIEWVKHGLEIAIMPLSSSFLINDDAIKVKKIVDPVSYANLYAVWEKDKLLSNSLQSFIDLL